MSDRVTAYAEVLEEMERSPRTWLVTGAAGFIGSNLVETLLSKGQRVRGLDNFSTGRESNLEDIERRVGERAWSSFDFFEGDVRDPMACEAACENVDVVLHQAAIGSVPRSMESPSVSHESNVTGTLNTLIAARDAGVKRFVLASSSSVYGDNPDLPKVEDRTGYPLSPYAASKVAAEQYAHVFWNAYGLPVVILRYFNVFGPRQDPEGPYAAVIPRWILAMLKRELVVIYGDGKTSRDFCFVDNVIQANVFAAVTMEEQVIGESFNVAVGESTTLNQLFNLIKERVARFRPETKHVQSTYGDFRAGDLRHSLASIDKAREALGYRPTEDVQMGLDATIAWYADRSK